MLNGRGLFIWHDDRLFLGDWKDNMMHGQGIYKWGDGRIFMGTYVDDRKNGLGIYLWADGRAYNGEWQQGKQHGTGYYIVPDQTTNELKIKKGQWHNGKRQEWKEEVSEAESDFQKARYQEIKDQMTDIEVDISRIEATMRELVLQQLGDKSHFDSSLKDLREDKPYKEQEYEPLESLIRNALNYDSNIYKQALGISDQTFGEPNGVVKSQEFQKQNVYG